LAAGGLASQPAGRVAITLECFWDQCLRLTLLRLLVVVVGLVVGAQDVAAAPVVEPLGALDRVLDLGREGLNQPVGLTVVGPWREAEAILLAWVVAVDRATTAAVQQREPVVVAVVRGFSLLALCPGLP
jgi:hypothetical protein